MFMPMPEHDYAEFAIFVLFSGGFAFTLVYNKLKYVRCFPGPPRQPDQ